LADWSDVYRELRAAGGELAALSVDEEARSEALRRDLGLEFPLLCDSGRGVVRAYGLFNQREMGGIAYPAVFVIDSGRVVRFRALEKTGARVEPRDVVALVRALGAGGAPTAPRPRAVWPGAMWVRAMTNAMLRGLRSPWHAR
jgi:peroxiredoxin